MKEAKHIIWSNYGLDYEDWREDLEAEYPSLSENERLFLMYEINSEYLNDERMNLNVQLSQPILMVGDLELWDGQRTGYKEIKSGNIRDCLYGDTDYSTWYVDRLGDLRCEAIHHDGTNHYLYRVYKDGVSELAAITYFLVAAKTKKPWALFIFCAVTGIYGFYPPMIICCIIAGIISALIAWKTGCTNGKTLTISYIIYMVLAAFSGTYIPFLFFSNQTLEQYAGMFGESYLGILQTLVSPVTAIIMLVVVAICAFVGALIAKKLLKKHFKKAGMV